MKNPVKRITALLLCAALFLLGGCQKKEEIKSLVYDLSGQPRTIDPQFATSESAATVIANTYEGLTRLSDAGEPQGACAEGWKVSPDGLTYTFTLREGLLWENGDPLTAQDFAFALRRLFGETPSPAAADFSAIVNAPQILAGELPASALGVSAPDSRTLVITLSAPHSALPALLARPSAMPCQERFFLEQKGRYGLSAEQTLGNGPFAVDSWTDRAVTLVKNQSYHHSIALDRVVLYLDRGDPVRLFLDGRSDGVLVAFRRLSELGDYTGALNYDQSWVLLFDRSQGSCADEAVRQAFISALDLEGLSVFFPQGTLPSEGIIPRDATLSERSYRELAGSVRRAVPADSPRALLQDALARLELEDVGRLTLLVSDFEPGPSIGGQLQKSWQESLSAFVNMEQLPYEELLARVQSGRFSIAVAPLTAQGSGTVDFLSRFAVREQADGDGTLQADEPTVAVLLERARSRTDPKVAAADLLAAEQRLIDDFIVTPLFDAPSSFVLKDGVEGVRYNAVSHTVYFADAVIR